MTFDPVPRVALCEVGLSLGGRRILEGIDLSLHAGELVSIVGPSGSGKSSLLRIISGLQKPGSGAVLVDGVAMNGPRPDIALAFQDACLLPWLSVEKNVAFGLNFADQPRLSRNQIQARVAAALAEVSLSAAGRYSPHQLSGGMAQRVALARCLARAPRVLLLDEPFGALDEATRSEMQRLIVNVVATTQAATLLVTHDIDEALLISNRVIVLDHHGTLADTFSVDLPQPRESQLQTLGALRIRVMEVLHRAVTHARQ